MPRRFALGNFSVERRPFGAPLAALETEAGLLAGIAVVALLRIDRHATSVTFLVAELVGSGLQHLEVVVAGQTWDVVGTRHPHLVFGLGVIWFEFSKGDRPVEQVGALDLAIGGECLEFVFLQAQRGTGPMRGGSTHRLDDPGRQVGKVLRDTPVARSRAHVLPGELGETVPLVVDEVVIFVARSCFEDDDVDALLGKFVAERAAAGTRADDDDHAIILQVEWCCHGFLP